MLAHRNFLKTYGRRNSAQELGAYDAIDQMRYNFQFGADMCYRIRNGKIAEPLRDVIYQSITPEFWGSCDAICDASEWQMHGVFNCGKGHPTQGARMMHGASPSRFHANWRQVTTP
jgi:TldD protein